MVYRQTPWQLTESLLDMQDLRFLGFTTESELVFEPHSKMIHKHTEIWEHWSTALSTTTKTESFTTYSQQRNL